MNKDKINFNTKTVHALLRMSSLARLQHNKKLKVQSHSWRTFDKSLFLTIQTLKLINE